MIQTFILDWPPSTNTIWRAYKGRNILALRYRQWRDGAGKQLVSLKVKPIKGPVFVEIELCSPTKRSFDLDNRIKPILDLLVINGVIEADDAMVVPSLHVRASSGFVGARITLTPLETDTLAVPVYPVLPPCDVEAA